MWLGLEKKKYFLKLLKPPPLLNSLSYGKLFILESINNIGVDVAIKNGW